MKFTRTAPLLAVTICLSPLPVPAGAQGLDSEQAIETIVGSEVEEQQANAADQAGKVVAAIEKTLDATATVRKISNVSKLEIVYLPDVADGNAPAEIEKAVAEHEKEIDELRKEIEGNAMLFHAIDSRALLIRDVLAVDFAARDEVVIYAAAHKPD